MIHAPTTAPEFSFWLGGMSSFNGMVSIDAIVANNDGTENHVFSRAEMLALGVLTDRLEALEDAVRVRPCRAAIAELRDYTDMCLAGDGPASGRLHAHAADILLDMLAKIEGVLG